MRRKLGGLTLSMVMLSGCGGGGDGGGSVTDNTPQSVVLDFALTANGLPVKCGTTLPAMGLSNVTSTPKDLRFYISEVHLLKADDTEIPVTLDQNEFQVYNVALMDFEDATGECASGGTPALHTRITGTVPAGTYQGVKMVMGVPLTYTGSDGQTVKLNHSDTTSAPAPLNVTAMAWSWQAGRKFTKIEVNPVGGVTKADSTTASTFNFHLGSTGCTGNPASGETVSCASPNRMAFHFHAFDPTTQKIILDLAKLYAGTTLNTDSSGAVGCMSGKTDPECAPLFQALQIDLETGLPIDEGHKQTIFSVGAK